MPNIKSAAKRVKTAAKANLRNRSIKSELLTFRRKVEDALVAGDKAAAEAAVSVYASKLDKAAKRGVIKSNTADRKKSRSAAALAKLAYLSARFKSHLKRTVFTVRFNVFVSPATSRLCLGTRSDVHHASSVRPAILCGKVARACKKGT